MDPNGDGLDELQRRLGHRFAHPDLLRRAVTHASAEPRSWNAYERLEFLGDRVLGLVVAEQLLDRFPHAREGEIARRHARLVRGETLAEVARGLELGRFLIVSRGEQEAGTRRSDSVLSDAMEAAIAALYLDGGLEVARRFVLSRWNPIMERDPGAPRDAKTALQEWTQARRLGLPLYETIERSGPAHAPEFVVRVTIGGHAPRVAAGRAKRAAEQAAAALLLADIDGDPTP